MIYFLQLLKLVEDKNYFLELFNDLSFEINEMGYKGMEDELVSMLLDSHFDLHLEDHKQLDKLTNFILQKQGRLHMYKVMV